MTQPKNTTSKNQHPTLTGAEILWATFDTPGKFPTFPTTRTA